MHVTLKHLITILIFATMLSGCKELSPMMEKVKPYIEQAGGASTKAGGISSEQMVTAIKQALSQGTRDAVNLLGSARGFSLSDVYHISIPQQLQQPADLLRKIGQGEKVDAFESRLNLAAEQSVQKAIPVFTSAIQQMSIRDAVNILQGADNAGTIYFKDKTESTLRTQFMPIIQQATGETGLTRAYKSLSDKITSVTPVYRSRLVDIDEYVLSNTMDALFDRIAVEEKMIRENPASRGTEIMKKVYGYFEK